MSAKQGGCLSVLGKAVKLVGWLLLWPILATAWLWKRGTVGKVAAGTFVMFLVVAVASAPRDEMPADTASDALMETTATRGEMGRIALATATLQVDVALTATIVASDTPTSPTATSVPTDTPTAVPTVAARANGDANLRAGPGTEFTVNGSVRTGDGLAVVGRNVAGDWYVLADGNWIAAFLVEGAPDDVAVAAVIPTVAAPTATAVIAQSSAAPVPSPVQVSTSPQANPQAFTCVGGCAVAPDPSCAIKGNVNSRGDRIYHTRSSRSYNNTDVKPEEGDRWFCTEEEARAAGFRAPLN